MRVVENPSSDDDQRKGGLTKSPLLFSTSASRF